MGCDPSPCFLPDPDICTPPPTTSDAKQVTVIDVNGCYRVMQDVTDQMAFLVKDSVTGKLRFVNGDAAAGKAIFIGDVSDTTSPVTSLLAPDSTGNLKKFKPPSLTDAPLLAVLSNVGTIAWESFKSSVLSLWGVAGSAYGVFTRNSAGDLTVVNGNDGDVLQKVSGEWVAYAITIPPAAQPFGYENLEVKTAGYNNTTVGKTVTVSIGKVVVYDGMNNVTLSAVNEIANISTSGVNGLDTGSVAINTWYYLYVIYNGVSVDLLISANAVTPALPAGYTYFKFIGTLKTDATPNFVQTYQRDDLVSYYSPKQAAARTQADDANELPISDIGIWTPPVAKFWTAQLLTSSVVTTKVVSVIINVVPLFTSYTRQNRTCPALFGSIQYTEFVDIPFVNPAPAWLADDTIDTSGSYTATINVIAYRL